MNAPVNFDPQSDAWNSALDQIDVSDPLLYQNDVYHPYFERLRREDPVHYRKGGMYGDFWSVTKFKDIMHVETHHQLFSSSAMRGGITITDRPMQHRRVSFISMDPPRHDQWRALTSPRFRPRSIATLAITTLLKTGTEFGIDRLVRQLTGSLTPTRPRLRMLSTPSERQSWFFPMRGSTTVRTW